jgi:hypothetical protein
MPWLVLLLVQPLFVVLALRPGVSGSRRWLAASLALVVPLVGPLLAILVRRARGRVPCALKLGNGGSAERGRANAEKLFDLSSPTRRLFRRRVGRGPDLGWVVGAPTAQ